MATDNGTLNDISLSELLFSDEWNLDKTTRFMQHNWVPMSYKITLVYLAIVYWGQKWMQKRKALDSKPMNNVLAVWNFAFSMFSAYSAYCLLPELFNVFRHQGFVGSYCQNAEYYNDPSTGYWGWMFVMSKAPELGDTMFLILRKRPVIFLHWYHHALTFLYATITYAEKQAWCRWSLALNLSVHTVMYFYFGLQAMKIRSPRIVAKFITSIQILQFVISVYIFTHIVYIKFTDVLPCDASWNVLSLGGLMYLSYLYLFAQFFYDSYISGKMKKRSLATTSSSNAMTEAKKIE
ncbi:hypothetical protein niasHT_013875 [Heterodera trifolii]|uniref:Elongation of very long chain fatty acids protein n=1 Tax=Heterodera trifolii TaxID=157864 RepID=A0ABD2L498_9BILA